VAKFRLARTARLVGVLVDDGRGVGVHVDGAGRRCRSARGVMSALHHNPGMIASAAETLDEICGGRFVLGLGAGHAGGGAKEFGYPADRTVSRYAEALEIIVPLLRGDSVSFTGQFHRAQGAEVLPRGPRPGRIPLMLGGHAPRTMGLAARHADTWSAFATTSSLPETFRPMTAQLDQICEGIGRDPASIGRSVGVIVEPGDEKVAEALGFGVAIRARRTRSPRRSPASRLSE
jgi:alkanesulfonate monooxygenase SsuD/methylene tetrahydromethanopterin reductase-like flavin-dependent oxidoreductase (luciferase family)